MNHKRIITIGLIAGAAVFGVAACSSTSANSADQNATNSLHDRLDKNQPIPSPDFSQYRQTLIDVENAQISGEATTTFFFPPAGSAAPIKTCPSIGFAIASTSQITSPDQFVTGGNGAAAAVGQMEPNGTYTGNSSGTYVVCVAPDGTKSISYWEGAVETEPGPAHWDGSQIVLDHANVVANDKQSTGH